LCFCLHATDDQQKHKKEFSFFHFLIFSFFLLIIV
jgi:hypothetical protein